MQYRRTATDSEYSPSELLNNRQLRAVIDTLLPSPPHIAQSKLNSSNDKVNKTSYHFKIGDPCYTLHFGPRRNQDPRWVPAVIVIRQSSRTFHVRVVLTRSIWHGHLNQFQPRYVSDSDNDIKDVSSTFDDVQEPSSESFNSKEESLSSSFTEESSPSFVTPASDPTTLSSDPPYTRDDPPDQEDVQIFMFRSVMFICCAYLLLSSGGVVYFDLTHIELGRVSHLV